MRPLRDLIHIKRQPEKPINGIYRTKLVYDRDQQETAEVLSIGSKVKDVEIGDTITFKTKDIYMRDTDKEMISEANVLFGRHNA